MSQVPITNINSSSTSSSSSSSSTVSSGSSSSSSSASSSRPAHSHGHIQTYVRVGSSQQPSHHRIDSKHLSVGSSTASGSTTSHSQPHHHRTEASTAQTNHPISASKVSAHQTHSVQPTMATSSTSSTSSTTVVSTTTNSTEKKRPVIAHTSLSANGRPATSNTSTSISSFSSSMTSSASTSSFSPSSSIAKRLPANVGKSTPHWNVHPLHLTTHSPSRAHNIDYTTECRLRAETADFLARMGEFIKITQWAIATGSAYLQVFFTRHSFSHYDRFEIAATALFLAGKVEERRTRVDQVITAYFHIRLNASQISSSTSSTISRTHKDYTSPPATDSDEFEIMRQRLYELEWPLLDAIQFEFEVSHPYTNLMVYLREIIYGSGYANQSADFIRKETTEKGGLAQFAWMFINDSLRTSLCLQYPRDTICVGVIFTTLNFKKLPHPTKYGEAVSKHTKPWYNELFGVEKKTVIAIADAVIAAVAQRYKPEPFSLELLRAKHVPSVAPTLSSSSSLYQPTPTGTGPGFPPVFAGQNPSKGKDIIRIEQRSEFSHGQVKHDSKQSSLAIQQQQSRKGHPSDQTGHNSSTIYPPPPLPPPPTTTLPPSLPPLHLNLPFVPPPQQFRVPHQNFAPHGFHPYPGPVPVGYHPYNYSNAGPPAIPLPIMNIQPSAFQSQNQNPNQAHSQHHQPFSQQQTLQSQQNSVQSYSKQIRSSNDSISSSSTQVTESKTSNAPIPSKPSSTIQSRKSDPLARVWKPPAKRLAAQSNQLAATNPTANTTIPAVNTTAGALPAEHESSKAPVISSVSQPNLSKKSSLVAAGSSDKLSIDAGTSTGKHVPRSVTTPPSPFSSDRPSNNRSPLPSPFLQQRSPSPPRRRITSSASSSSISSQGSRKRNLSPVSSVNTNINVSTSVTAISATISSRNETDNVQMSITSKVASIHNANGRIHSPDDEKRDLLLAMDELKGGSTSEKREDAEIMADLNKFALESKAEEEEGRAWKRQRHNKNARPKFQHKGQDDLHNNSRIRVEPEDGEVEGEVDDRAEDSLREFEEMNDNHEGDDNDDIVGESDELDESDDEPVDRIRNQSHDPDIYTGDREGDDNSHGYHSDVVNHLDEQEEGVDAFGLNLEPATETVQDDESSPQISPAISPASTGAGEIEEAGQDQTIFKQSSPNQSANGSNQTKKKEDLIFSTIQPSLDGEDKLSNQSPSDQFSHPRNSIYHSSLDEEIHESSGSDIITGNKNENVLESDNNTMMIV